MSAENINRRIALITGASRGIGRVVARRFIEEGMHVIAVARTVSALEELDDYAKTMDNNITIVPLDVTQFLSISELGFAIYQKFGRLDVLVGNAGMLGGCSPIGHYKPSLWQKIIDTNLTANWHFLRNFDQLLRQSKAGRVIFVTSEFSQTAPAYYGAYSVSKAGLETLAMTYVNETKLTNIKTNLISPPDIKTRLRSEAFPSQGIEDLMNPEDLADIFSKFASENCQENGMIVRNIKIPVL